MNARWEYRFIVFSMMSPNGEEPFQDAERMLNEEGRAGWEVVSVMPKMGKGDSWTVALMKRLRSA